MKITKTELKQKLKALGKLTDQQRNEIICSLIGHSNIVDNFMGYKDCARCGARLGDSLLGYYFNPNAVITGHRCGECAKNFKRCTWVDKLYVKDPMVEREFGEEDKRKYLMVL